MKENLIIDVIDRKRKIKDVAKILNVSRKTIYKWKCRYEVIGEDSLLPRKPGPKKGISWNRTREDIEEIVVKLAFKYKREGPLHLSIRLEDEYNIKINQTTVYRILKRRKVRYYWEYEKPKKVCKLYSLEKPGEEVQVDTSFHLVVIENLLFTQQ